MKRIKISFLISALAIALTARVVQAVCPACTIAATAGVGLCRWLGIDDIISGIWLGGMIVSSTLWFLSWLNKKKPAWKKMDWPVFILMYAIVVVPLYFTNIIGHPNNRIWGIDKLLSGIVIGSLVFALSIWLHSYLKKKNNGRSFFPLQKAAVPVIFLIIASFLAYFIAK